jgi:hypothetical protein
MLIRNPATAPATTFGILSSFFEAFGSECVHPCTWQGDEGHFFTPALLDSRTKVRTTSGPHRFGPYRALIGSDHIGPSSWTSPALLGSHWGEIGIFLASWRWEGGLRDGGGGGCQSHSIIQQGYKREREKERFERQVLDVQSSRPVASAQIPLQPCVWSDSIRLRTGVHDVPVPVQYRTSVRYSIAPYQRTVQ